jgi:hypothetical protein
MESSSSDFSTILNRILDTAADNLRIAKILVQMGLDPSNITYDALFNRLVEIVLANITLANMFALVGAIFFVATLLMQTMVPLRGREHGRLYILRRLWRALRKRRDFSPVSAVATDQCRSPPSNAQAHQEGT